MKNIIPVLEEKIKSFENSLLNGLKRAINFQELECYKKLYGEYGVNPHDYDFPPINRENNSWWADKWVK